MKDGGPAYPQPQVSDGLGGIEYTEVEGMSLRDWFAGQALPATLMEFMNGARCGDYGFAPDWRDGVASDAYKIADAMLKAREES